MTDTMHRGAPSAHALFPVPAYPYPVVSPEGTIHLRYRLGHPGGSLNRTVDDGRCGIDDNWHEVSFSTMSEASVETRCEFCFPR